MPPVSEQPLIMSRDPKRVEYFRGMLMNEMKRVVGAYERAYLPELPFHFSQERIRALQSGPFTSERYRFFEEWVGHLLDQGELPLLWDEPDNRETIPSDIASVVSTYEALQALCTNKTLAAPFHDRFEKLIFPKDHEFWLDDTAPNIFFPLGEDTKRNFRLTKIEPILEQVRTVDAFRLSKWDLDGIEYGKGEPSKRFEMLRNFRVQRPQEAMPAQIFRIEELIRAKYENQGIPETDPFDPAYPPYPQHLDTRELFEAFDAAGVRPATFVELLTYARQWDPATERDPDSEAVKKGFHFSKVYALGAPFVVDGSPASGLTAVVRKGFPRLHLNYGFRELGYTQAPVSGIDIDWFPSDSFLVFRKN